MAPEQSRLSTAAKPLAAGRIAIASLFIASAPLLIGIQTGPGKSAGLAMLYAVAATIAFLFAAPLLRPSGRQIVSWSTIVALLAATAVLLNPESRVAAASLATLALLVFIVSAFLGTLAMRVEREIVVAVYVTLLLSPLWAGPMLELAGNPSWASASILATSPLTAFAIVLDFDFLRTPWFYDHSAIAAMRYRYPDLVIPVLLFSVLPSIVALRAASRHFRSRPTSNEVSS